MRSKQARYSLIDSPKRLSSSEYFSDDPLKDDGSTFSPVPMLDQDSNIHDDSTMISTGQMLAQEWKRIVPILVVAFLAYFKPAEPFLTQYLTNDKLLSQQQIYQDIYPIWTYAQLFLLLSYGLCAEYIS